MRARRGVRVGKQCQGRMPSFPPVVGGEGEERVEEEEALELPSGGDALSPFVAAARSAALEQMGWK